ncbi:hypothetical protein DN53_05020 [Flagellimonas olearia]|uniref:Uncharacterized protein n=2 Tax=Flagellimonas olearia TaxID=552546 RepID=A0A444VSC4_9FLAO|nr:hypothetical protein DN53_05020 [Allomuricauda olearia]
MHPLPKNAFLAPIMEKDETFKEWVEDGYGSPEKLAQILELGIFMLFFLEEDTFSRREVQDVVEAMKGIVGELRKPIAVDKLQ